MTDNTSESTDLELVGYGYAPGHYMNTCKLCEKLLTGVDKRCYCCKECAIARRDEDKRCDPKS